MKNTKYEFEYESDIILEEEFTLILDSSEIGYENPTIDQISDWIKDNYKAVFNHDNEYIVDFDYVDEVYCNLKNFKVSGKQIEGEVLDRDYRLGDNVWGLQDYESLCHKNIFGSGKQCTDLADYIINSLYQL